MDLGVGVTLQPAARLVAFVEASSAAVFVNPLEFFATSFNSGISLISRSFARDVAEVELVTGYGSW